MVGITMQGWNMRQCSLVRKPRFRSWEAWNLVRETGWVTLACGQATYL